MIRILLAVAALAATAGPAAAQPAVPLFESDAPLRLTLSGPLPELMRNRENDQVAAGTMTVAGGQPFPIGVKLRGLTRRTADICDFPPLRIDFAGQAPATSPFAGQKQLKLVTHCRNSPGFQQHLLLEYAAYKMFNLLTPRSFRVRLAQIDYRDSSGGPIALRDGFFIEDLPGVARRNGVPMSGARERISVADLNSADAGRYSLFQHLIANHDWSMRAGPPREYCCHNAQLIGRMGAGTVTPVPYDFDFSGLVSAPYATPPDILRLGDVRQRLYRGYCLHNDQALAAARQMLALRPQMLAVLNEVPGLLPATKAKAEAFLARFFTDIASDSTMRSKTLRTCLR